MALKPAHYVNPYDPTNPTTTAYVRIGFLLLRPENGTGSMVLNVHASAAARQANAPPIDQISLSLGQQIQESGERVATLAELMADPEFAAAYAVVSGKLYGEAKKIPSLADSADV